MSNQRNNRRIINDMCSKEGQGSFCKQSNCKIAAHILFSPGYRITPLWKVAAKLKIKLTAPQVLWTV